MPLKRKCLSGHAKRLKNKKDAELIKSLRGSLDRFLTKEPEGLGENLNGLVLISIENEHLEKIN